MPDHKFPHYGPEDAITNVRSIMDFAGDKLQSVTITPTQIEVSLTEPIDFPFSVDLIEHMRSLSDIKILEASEFEEVTVDNAPSYIMEVYKAVAKISYPRFFVVSPGSLVKKTPLWAFIHYGTMYRLLFGMIVLEDDRIDEQSFLIGGSTGLGTEISTINVVYKGFIQEK